MAAHPIRIAHPLKTLASALIVLAVSVAGLPAAQAAPILIDDFTDGGQDFNSANTTNSGEVQTSSGIGGYRFLSAGLSDGLGAVNGTVEPSLGILDANALSPEALPFAGNVTARWDGQGDAGLGGIDLLAAGDLFNLDVALVANAAASTVRLRVTDTMGMGSSASRSADDLFITQPNLFPFSGLDGNANLASIDSIQLEIVIGGEASAEFLTIQINELSVVPIPEPTTALLLGSALLGLGMTRRRRAA